MSFRVLLTVVVILLAKFSSAQVSRPLPAILVEYSDEARKLFREFTKTIQHLPENRVLKTTEDLTPARLYTALGTFNKNWNANALLLFYFHDGKSLHSFLLDE